MRKNPRSMQECGIVIHAAASLNGLDIRASGGWRWGAGMDAGTGLLAEEELGQSPNCSSLGERPRGFRQ